jgi:hypothetical protein
MCLVFAVIFSMGYAIHHHNLDKSTLSRNPPLISPIMLVDKKYLLIISKVTKYISKTHLIREYKIQIMGVKLTVHPVQAVQTTAQSVQTMHQKPSIPYIRGNYMGNYPQISTSLLYALRSSQEKGGTDVGLLAGVSRLLGGNARCIYGAPAGLTKLPYSLPNRSKRVPTGKVIMPWIGAPAVFNWKPELGG